MQAVIAGGQFRMRRRPLARMPRAPAVLASEIRHALENGVDVLIEQRVREWHAVDAVDVRLPE